MLIQRSHFIAILLVFLFVILGGCRSTVTTPDGPPSYYVDETRIPNATPRVEPLAKIGNKPSYKVFGKRYYTLRDYRNYDEVGVASWYGTKFHKRMTSSGEPYNMLGMTAAHRTLPLPTYVEVTNLKNHRTIIVKVNDRGPFNQRRIIDLSYVAAKKLGMLAHGTAPVRVRAIDPRVYGAPTTFASKSSHTRPSRVYLQVGAFRDRNNAEKLRSSLATALNAPVNVSFPNFGSSYYKVRVGPIDDPASANVLTRRLYAMGFKPSRLVLGQ
jgi:rare lipoprotein A